MTDKTAKDLTPLQHRFALAYAKHGVAAKAAREAGAQGKDAKSFASIGNRLLNEEGVREVIADMQKELIVSAGLDENEVVTQLRQTALEARVAGKYDAAVKAYEKLGNYLGMFGSEGGQKKTPVKVIDVFTQNSEGDTGLDEEIRKYLSTDSAD